MTWEPNSQHSSHLVAAQLRQIGLFGALPDEVLEQLSQILTTAQVETGSILFREGEDGRDMYVLLNGEMEVLKRSKGGADARVALLGPGDWFGEMSIVDIQPRSASVRALAPSVLLRVSTGDLDFLYRHDLRSYALVVLNLARELSRRLRVADGILADLIASVFDSVFTRRGPEQR